MVARTMKIPDNRLDIRPMPAGGSFGSKLFATKPRDSQACARGRSAGRSSTWRTGSTTSPTATTTAPTGSTMSSSRVMRDGDACAASRSTRWRTTAPTSSSAWATTATRWRRSIGPYRITSVEYRVRAALTNKNQQGAYRGFGSEVNNWMLEQMVDKAARELGMDPVDDPPPATSSASSRTSSPPATSTTPVTTTQVLDKALELAEYKHWRAEQASGCASRAATSGSG